MIGTFFGFLIALFLFYNPIAVEKYANLNVLSSIFIAVSIFLIFIENMAFIMAWTPLQKAVEAINPHLLNLFKKDRQFRLVNGWLFVFALATLFIAMNISILNIFNQNLLVGIWVVLFGFSFDCLQYGLRRVLSYFNPFAVLDMFKAEGVKNIQDEREIDFYDRLDAITETASKGIENKTPFVTNYALDSIQSLSRVFFESSKSIGHRNSDAQTKEYGIQDKVSYTLSYLLERVDLIFQKALDGKWETVLTALVTKMGKICMDAAKYDISLCLQPLRALGKFSVKSIENKFQKVGVVASCTLLEVAKRIIAEIDLSYLEIQEPFLCLIQQLENSAKELFKQDKSSKIMVLIQPFLELKQLFSSEKLINHQDAAVITKDLDRVIGEFQILENVIRTMPPVTIPSA